MMVFRDTLQARAISNYFACDLFGAPYARRENCLLRGLNKYFFGNVKAVTNKRVKAPPLQMRINGKLTGSMCGLVYPG